jgi:hypothetical protein
VEESQARSNKRIGRNEKKIEKKTPSFKEIILCILSIQMPLGFARFNFQRAIDIIFKIDNLKLVWLH